MKNYRIYIAATLALLLGVQTVLASATKITLTIDEQMKLEGLYSLPDISPDGKQIVYSSMSANFEYDTLWPTIWVVNSESGEKYKLSETPATNGQWSPNGKWIAFLQSNQIVISRPDGSEAKPITNSISGILSYAWSPNSQKIAYVEGDALNEAPEGRDNKKGEYIVWLEDASPGTISIVDIKSGRGKPGDKVLKIHTGGMSVKSMVSSPLAWSPDQTKIAFSATPSVKWEEDSIANLYVADLHLKKSRVLASLPGAQINPHWSPDGSEIIFNTQSEVDGNNYLAAIPSTGGNIELITESFDEDPHFSAWHGDWIYFTAQQKTTRHLFRVSRQDMTIERVSGPNEFYAGADFWENSFSISSNGEWVAFFAGSPTDMTELFVSRLGIFTPRKLTEFSRQLDPFRVATREVISWKSKDGLEIEGILHRSKTFDEGIKHPLIVLIHGGPLMTESPLSARGGPLSYPIDYWADKGAVVLTLNYRGSGGYGEAFRLADVGLGPLQEMEDIHSGIDFLTGKGYIDESRIGATGWSHGGYLSAFLAATSDRFKAVSIGAGITNWSSYYYNSWQYYTVWTTKGGTPTQAQDMFRKTSPMTYIANFKTPALIQHGAADRQVPVGQAYELARELSDRGIENTLIIYPNMDHVSMTPKRATTIMQQNIDWFDHYLFDGEKPDFTRF